MSQIVELEKASHGACWESCPHRGQVVEVRRFVYEILLDALAFAAHDIWDCSDTHTSEEPECSVVQDQPCLLGKANGGLLLVNAAFSSHWDQGVVHSSCAKSGEDDDAERDKLQVLPSWVVETGFGIIVGEGKVLDGRGSEAGETDVSQNEKHEHVDGQAWDRSALPLLSQCLVWSAQVYLVGAQRG